MKKLISIILFVLALVACGGRQAPQPHFSDPNTAQAKPEMSLDTALWNSFSPERQQVMLKLHGVIAEHMKLENGKMCLAMSLDEFQQAGLPDSLYHQLVRECETNNKWMDSLDFGLDERMRMHEELISSCRQQSGN